MVQVDRTKKPLSKISDSGEKPAAESPAVGKKVVSNGKVVPDRSTKPAADAKAEEDKNHRVPAENVSQLEKSKPETEPQEKQEEEPREGPRQAKVEQEQKDDQEGRERRVNLPKEKDEEAERVADEKQEVDKTSKDLAEIKKPRKTGSDTPDVKKLDTDRIAASQKGRVTWTPETQRRKLSEEPPGSASGPRDFIPSKVSCSSPTEGGRHLLRGVFPQVCF